MADPVLVAAIDFGTTFSGYAYSFHQDYKRDPLKISSNNWIAGSMISLKTPSTVLLNPEKKFDSFGYEAEDKFASLAETGQHKRWLYFRRFKMILHRNKSLKRTTEIKDENGHIMPALAIFTMAIKYLKDHLLKTVNLRVHGFDENMITWVLTVPAIWDEGAKQFMRLAAQEAGIGEDQLLLSLEPEAASIYCNKSHIKQSMNKKGHSSAFCKGTKYMVLDLGGGTADITVHEIQGNGKLREISQANGGAWGGTKVDNAFYQFLVKLFGNDVLTELKETSMDDYISMLRDFEIKKRSIKSGMPERVCLRLPLKLTDIFEKRNEETLQQTLPNSTFAQTVQVKGDKLLVHSEIFRKFFTDSIENITNYTLEILENCDIDIGKILLVGGFSESSLVYETFKSIFPEKEIINPQDSGLAVLKGAVLFGHEQDLICSRISRYTYGFEVFDPFIPGVHPEVYKVVRPDGRVMCRNVFAKYIEIGSEVPVGHEVCKSFTPSEEDATTGICVYTSTSKNPQFTSDLSCDLLGKIVIKKPNGGWTAKSQLHVSMEFGKTEFSVHIRDDCLNETYSRSYDFLK